MKNSVKLGNGLSSEAEVNLKACGGTCLPSPAFIFTLVHGTFAKEAPWTRKGSKVFDAVSNLFGQNALIKHFDWSGENSIVDRVQATESLAEQLGEDSKNYPDALHIIIAHSHGGNVAVHVADELDEKTRIFAIVCIATPFLSAGLRDLSFLSSRIVSDSILSIIYLALVISTVALGADLTLIIPVIFMSVLICGILGRNIISLIDKVREVASVLVDDINFDLSEEIRYLIVRKEGDEAAPALGASQLLSWSASKFFYGLSTKYNAKRIQKWTDLFFPLYITLPIAAGAILLAFDHFHILHYYLGEYEYHSAAIELVKFILYAALPCFIAYKYRLVGRYTIGFGLISLTAALSIYSKTFGLRLPSNFFNNRIIGTIFNSLLSLAIEINAEAVPIGLSSSMQFPKDENDRRSSNKILAHSAYEDPRVVDYIVSWLKQTMTRSEVKS